jgi:hypothetical protein
MLVRFLRSRHSLLLENLALRQQLVVLKRRHPRPKLDLSDKLFWLLVRRCWSGWKQALLDDRRRILHCNVTRHPTSLWIVQQLREAFPFDSAPRFLIFDRDAKYGLEVPAAVHSLKMRPVRTSFESPWQNGIAERWVGSCRRDLLDHVIALNERHLKRLLSEYVSYHHEDRTHWGLGKETPGGRPRSLPSGQIGSHPRLGGLHHRYDRAA